MVYEAGDLKVFNPNKEISKEIILEILIRHRDALKQARTGEVIGTPADKLKDNDRKNNQVRALNLVISAQREMITQSRPIIFFRSKSKWEKSNRNVNGNEIIPFNQEKNDYNNLLEWLEFLRKCGNAIIEADKTKKISDDFCRTTPDGSKIELTNNFYEMLEDLESSFEQIYLLMLTNKIVSAGIEEDEELTYKELEDAFRERVEEG